MLLIIIYQIRVVISFNLQQILSTSCSLIMQCTNRAGRWTLSQHVSHSLVANRHHGPMDLYSSFAFLPFSVYQSLFLYSLFRISLLCVQCHLPHNTELFTPYYSISESLVLSCNGPGMYRR